MATYTLRRFSQPDHLKAIKPEWLRALLGPYTDCLTSRGFRFPINGGEIAYESLARILMTPDDTLPHAMINALYYVHEMATPEGMDDLLEAAARAGLALAHDPDSSPADIAIQVWLASPTLLQEQHAQASARRKKSFTYFAGKLGRSPEVPAPPPPIRSAGSRRISTTGSPRTGAAEAAACSSSSRGGSGSS